MANEMVERVADALWQARYDVKNLTPSQDERDLMLKLARAAITAMREPTEAMMDVYSSDQRRCWQQMIDAALKDGDTDDPARS